MLKEKKLFFLIKILLWIFLSFFILSPLIFFVREAFTLLQTQEFFSLSVFSLINSFKFSFKQAFLSSLFSVALASINVYFLKKSPLYLRKILFAFLFIPSGVSAIVGILSFLTLFGKQGFIGYYFPFFSENFYSLKTLIFFNIIYNFSFLSLIFYSASCYFPYPLLKKSKKMGALAFQRFLSITLPLYKSHIFLGLSLSFIFCFMSFYSILFLGAKENFLSPEVLIYQKINREFNIPEASLIALLQWSFILFFIPFFISQRPLYEPYHEVKEEKNSLMASLLAIIISSLSLFLWFPLLIKILNNLSLSISVLKDSLNTFFHSFLIGIMSSLLITILCILIIESLKENLKNKKILIILFSPLGLSPLLTSYIYSLLLGEWFGFSSPFFSVVISQIILGLPLILYLLLHEMAEFQTLPQRAQKLGANKLQSFLTVTWPLFKKSYFKGFFFNFLFSFGNLSTGFLYLPKDFETVPLKIYRYLQSYRIEEAFILSGLFIIFFFFIFFIYQEISKKL